MEKQTLFKINLFTITLFKITPFKITIFLEILYLFMSDSWLFKYMIFQKKLVFMISHVFSSSFWSVEKVRKIFFPIKKKRFFSFTYLWHATGVNWIENWKKRNEHSEREKEYVCESEWVKVWVRASVRE